MLILFGNLKRLFIMVPGTYCTYQVMVLCHTGNGGNDGKLCTVF